MSSIVLKLPENVDVGDWLRTDETCYEVDVTSALGLVYLNGIPFNAETTIKVGAIDPPVTTLPKNVVIGDVFRWIRTVERIRSYLDENGDEQWEFNGVGPFDPTVQVKTLVEDDGTPA